MEWFSFPSFLCSIHICSQNMPRNSSENAATYSSFVSKFNIAFLRLFLNLKFSQFSCSVVFDSLWPYGLQHSRLPCSSPAPGACSNSCSLNRWCHPTISSSRPLLLPPSIFPSIRVFSNESVLHIRWPEDWSFSFSFSPSNESVQFSSVIQLCPTLYDPIDCRMPGFPVHHQLLELAQTHVHGVGEAIQPSHPLTSPSPPTLNLSHHQGLFQWVSSLHQVAKVLEFQLHHQSFQWIFKTDFL